MKTSSPRKAKEPPLEKRRLKPQVLKELRAAEAGRVKFKRFATVETFMADLHSHA